jgi:hypothetical protein
MQRDRTNDVYTPADYALMDRESRKREREIAKGEAMKETVAKGIAAALKNERIRQSVAKDALEATERGKYGMVDPILAKTAGVGGHTNRGYTDQEVITGMEERPWEQDNFDPWSD